MGKRTIIPFGPQHPVLPEPIHLDLVVEDEKVVARLEDAMEADREVANAIADIWAAALHGHKLEYNAQASYLDLGRDLGVDLSLEAYRNGVPAEHVIGSV